MNSKFYIKILLFLTALIFLIMTIISIRTTYARYVTSLTAGGSVELGRWLIKVNDQNIIQDSNISNTITPVIDSSDYIADGKIVPTSTGYAEIEFDYQEVTVPFVYDIKFTYGESTVIEDFKLTSYSIDGGEAITVDDTFTSITETITPDNATRTKTFKLNFAWLDETDEDATLTDIEDTERARNIQELGLRFDIKFTQLQPVAGT